MKRCPITYEACGKKKYSTKGLNLLHLSNLKDFPYTAEEQLKQAEIYATKLSIQGLQPKLSVKLSRKKEQFEITAQRGTYLLKPPHFHYKELPENEDLTMHLAALCGIEVPLHGMVYGKDGTLTYFIKRFDRYGHGKKLHVEDFAQLSNFSRETKYASSMEKVGSILEKHCTFQLLEKVKLFRLTLFSYLIGNEDLHLKNFSLIQREGKIELSPAYDLLNSTILTTSNEELALPLNGKKSNFKRSDFIDYFALKRLHLTPELVEEELKKFKKILPTWKEWIQKSFLSPEFQKKYLKVLSTRSSLFF